MALKSPGSPFAIPVEWALLSFRSSSPPLRETSIVISYPTPIDLEQGVCPPLSCSGPKPPDPSHPQPPPPSSTRKPVQRFGSTNISLKDALVYMPAFSVDSSGEGRTRSDLRSYDRGRYLQQSAPPPLPPHNPHNRYPPSAAGSVAPKPGGPPSGPRYMSVISNKSTFNGVHPAIRLPKCRKYPAGEPLQDLPPNPPLPSTYTTPIRKEAAPLKVPFVSPAPHSRRKYGRGHRRGPFAAITDISHINVYDSGAISRYPTTNRTAPKTEHTPVQDRDPLKFSNKSYGYPSLNDTPTPVVGAPLTPPLLVHSSSPTTNAESPGSSPCPSSVESSAPSSSLATPPSPYIVDSPCPSVVDSPIPHRGQSISFRRRPVYEILPSPSPPRSSPRKRSISRLWFNPLMTPEPQLSSIETKATRVISPLRIVKRAETPNRSPNTISSHSRSPTGGDCDDMQDVVSKVRAVFDLLRQGQDEEDGGAAARELLSRDSARTTDSGASTTPCSTTSGTKREATIPAGTGERMLRYDEEYGTEVSIRAASSPPPPYALSPALSPSDIYANLKRDSPLDAFKFIGDKPAKPSPASIAEIATPDLSLSSSTNTSEHRRPAGHSRRNLQVPLDSSPILTPTTSTELAYFKDTAQNGLLSPPQSPPTRSKDSSLTATTTDLRRQNSKSSLNPKPDSALEESPPRKRFRVPSPHPHQLSTTPSNGTLIAASSRLLCPTPSNLSLSTAVSTELSYLKEEYEHEQVDECAEKNALPSPPQPLPPPPLVIDPGDTSLDDILESFEHLMQSMGIKSKSATATPAAHVNPEPTRLVVPVPPPSPRSLRSTKPVTIKSEAAVGMDKKNSTKMKIRSRPETGCYVYGGLAEECDAQWCDLLELDNYHVVF